MKVFCLPITCCKIDIFTEKYFCRVTFVKVKLTLGKTQKKQLSVVVASYILFSSANKKIEWSGKNNLDKKQSYFSINQPKC